MTTAAPARMPVIFFGHGNPMNALTQNSYTEAWRKIGETVPRPKAVETLGRDARLSIPTPEHYLPLLYVIAQRKEGEPISFPVEGVDGGSISMLSIQIG